MTIIPSHILIHGDYWPEGTPEDRDQIYEGKIIAIITDSGGEMYAAFELSDQGGLQLISLGSRFFKGFTQADPDFSCL